MLYSMTALIQITDTTSQPEGEFKPILCNIYEQSSDNFLCNILFVCGALLITNHFQYVLMYILGGICYLC